MSHFESIESRRLLSAVLTGSELLIEGTAQADTIDVWTTKNGKKIMTSLNGDQNAFSIRSLREIEINTFNGNDRITISNRVSISTDIEAGAGDDLVSGGSGRDEIDGGSGNDTLYGNDGKDELDGEAGNDLIFGGADRDEIDGGSGADTLRGESGRDIFDNDDAASEILDLTSKEKRS